MGLRDDQFNNAFQHGGAAFRSAMTTADTCQGGQMMHKLVSYGIGAMLMTATPTAFLYAQTIS